MSILTDSLSSAMFLLTSLDPELLEIVLASITVSGASTLLASVIGIPAGFFIAFESFRGKRMVITILNTLLALPTVVIGLFIYSFISRQGALGSLDLLYTKKAIVMGQTILILPVAATFVIAAVNRIDPRYRRTAMTLGASRAQTAWVVFKEARFGIMAAIIAAYGRVISEIGISMMLGGNAKGFTRTMTTAMALEYNKGSFALAVALGMILLGLSFGINLCFHFFQGRTES